MQNSNKMKVGRDELTILQGRKQFGRTLRNCNVQTIEHRLSSVVTMYQKLGRYQDLNSLHLLQIAMFLKERYGFLMLGDIQSIFYLAHKGSIRPIEKVELIEIVETIDDYWKITESLILRMLEVSRQK